MKLLFTSDLDRTLIFSARTKLADKPYKCIEQLDGREISYVSNGTYHRLVALQRLLDFVPVTTRSLQQLERLSLFQGSLQPHLIIAANGGIILRDGIVDVNWARKVALEMQKLPLSYEQLPTHYEALFQAPFVTEVVEMDHLFYSLKVDKHALDMQQLHALQLDLQQYEWTCQLQGRKLYITPQFLTKGRAVQFIKEGYHWHFAAGDSFMDLSMLTLADTSFIPQHGELANSSAHTLKVMDERSSDYTELFLQQILDWICEKQNSRGYTYGEFK